MIGNPRGGQEGLQHSPHHHHHHHHQQQQQRGYMVELARATVELGKQASRAQMAPLSRLMSSITVGHMLDNYAHQLHPGGEDYHSPRLVYEVREDQPVIDAIKLMMAERVGSVIVRGTETQLHVGMLNRIDCMRKLVLKNRFARETPISRVMDTKVQCVTPGFTLAQCIEIMARGPQIRYLPVVTDVGDYTDQDTRITGILGQRDVLNWFVRSYLDAGDSELLGEVSAQTLFDREEKIECSSIYVSSDATVFDALQSMAARNDTYVLVNDGQQIAGIFTGTDYLEKIILPGRKSKETNIMDVVSKDLITAAPHYTLIDCISLMLQARIQHLPIGEWRSMLASEGNAGKTTSTTAFETDRYMSGQPLGTITAYDCIDFLDEQPKMLG